MARIFISYRHVDSRGHAGRLYDGLVAKFPEETVYRDVDNSAPGARIDERIRSELANCDAFVAVVGPRWAADGESDNWMQREIALALELRIRIFLVLVDDLRIRDLPAALAALTDAEALEVSDSRWEYDVGRLVDAIRHALADEALAPHGMAVARSLAEGRLVVVLGSSGRFGGPFALPHFWGRSIDGVLAALPGILRRKGYDVPLRLVTTEADDGLESALRDAGEEYRLADTEHSVFRWAFSEPFVPAPRTIVVKLEPPGPRLALTPTSPLETLLTARHDFPLELTVWLTDNNDFLFLGGGEHDESVARIVKRRHERSHGRAWVADVPSAPIAAHFWESHGVEVIAADRSDYGRALTRQVEALPPVDVAATG